MLLTETYRELNRKLHENPIYGTSGSQWAKNVLSVCRERGTFDVLDYGCGKRTLEQTLGFPIQNYDPCIPGLDGPPKPADIVACIDVLEHIEPECIDAVLADIARLTKVAAFLLIANRPAMKMLPDGRNAHLIQEGPEWWLPRLWKAGFKLSLFRDAHNQGHSVGFLVVVDAPTPD